MKLLFRIFAAALFIVFFGFALKNTQEARLLFFMNYEIHGPLVLLLLGSFAVGAILGVFAMMPTMFRHRRELAKQRKTILRLEKENQEQLLARTQAPQPGSMIEF